MHNFIVFWFPTIFHHEKKRRNIKNPIVISDGSDHELMISVLPGDESFDENNNGEVVGSGRDLKFRVKGNSSKGEWEFDIMFHCESQSRNGFAVYSYDRNYMADKIAGNDLESTDKVIDKLLGNMYHHAKSLYHEHEVRSNSTEEADAKLEAYYYELDKDGKKQYLNYQPTLSTHNNKVLCYFLNQFESRFKLLAETISKEYRQIEYQANKFKDQFAIILKISKVDGKIKPSDNQLSVLRKCLKFMDLYENPPFGSGKDLTVTADNYLQKCRDYQFFVYKVLQNYLVKIKGVCENALIEYTYSKTLLCSKYNNEYEINIDFDNTELWYLSKYNNYLSDNIDEKLKARDQRRKYAFNIKNSIRYIVDIQSKCETIGTEILLGLINMTNILSVENQEIIKSTDDLTQKNTKVLDASEKSNRKSSALGWMSVGLGIVSLYIAYGVDNSSNKWILFIGLAAIVYAVYSIIKDNITCLNKTR